MIDLDGLAGARHLSDGGLRPNGWGGAALEVRCDLAERRARTTARCDIPKVVKRGGRKLLQGDPKAGCGFCKPRVKLGRQLQNEPHSLGLGLFLGARRAFPARPSGA